MIWGSILGAFWSHVGFKNLKKIDIAERLSIATGFSFRLSKKLVDDLVILLLKNIKSGIGALSFIKCKFKYNAIINKTQFGAHLKTSGFT